jgi:hypothetical protein
VETKPRWLNASELSTRRPCHPGKADSKAAAMIAIDHQDREEIRIPTGQRWLVSDHLNPERNDGDG